VTINITSGPSNGSIQYNGVDKIVIDSGNVSVTGNSIVSGNLTVNGSLVLPVSQLFSASYNVTGSRVLNTNYTNNTGKPMFVTVTTSANVLNSVSAGTLTQTDLYINNISVLSTGGIVGGVTGASTFVGTLTAIVAPGQQYKVNKSTGNGTVTIPLWFETY